MYFLITSQYKEARAVETISKLKHLLDKQKDILLGDKNLNSFAEYDTLFHTTIVSYAQNTEFDKMFNNYMYRIKISSRFIVTWRKAWNNIKRAHRYF